MSTTTRASSRNHNHKHTPLPSRAANSGSSTTINNSHSNQNTTHRLDMHLPPTPPAERLGAHNDGENRHISGGSGRSEAPTTPNASPRPGKFGGSPCAPSFASVVSSSSATRSSARSPLSTMPTSSLHQHTQQTQEHAQIPAVKLSLELSKLNLDEGITCDNTPVVSVSSPTFNSSLGSSLMPKEAAEPVVSVSGTDTASGSPNAVDGNDGEREQDNDNEDSESSDIEIYLNTLGLHDSAARMHVFVGPGSTGSTATTASTRSSTKGQTQIQSSNESPTLPSTAHCSGNATNQNANTLALRVVATDLNSNKSLSPLSFASSLSGTSPTSHQHSLQLPQNGGTNTSVQLGTAPSAPTHGTIPLPNLDENEYIQDADARQLQNLQQHQQMHSQPVVHDNGTIDLSGLSVGGGMSEAVRGQQQALGLPSSHSQPMLSVDPPFDSHGDSMGLGPVTPAFPTSVSDSGLSGAGQKTPNVYINGLPPHFREDQLFDIACPFGAIRSVRTFTRHVRDSESGYGFVLFETIDAAERCIISLRRYRNLHPTFSKQIHKIPGTTYAQGAVAPSSTSTWNEHSLGSESGSIGDSNEGSLGADATFKAKMESLQDPTSTNLYMEGLPLSIDEPTLAALVAPHVISSSRFFHTRLSNPPRIIAFVRLETRKGAEEIIERLHGRMVRGWNDTGSRISVRFADTSEQRELRRTERSAQEGDSSPARLTIAQAALLNLRGKELGPENAGPVIHARGPGTGRIPTAPSGGFSVSASAPDFSPNAHPFSSVNELAVDYSLAPGRGAMTNPASRSPYQNHQDLGYRPADAYASQAQVGFHHSSAASMDSNMAALLTSLSNTNLSYQGVYENAVSDNEYIASQHMGHTHQYPIGHSHLAGSQSLDDIHQYSRPAPAYTRSGYTPTEEYIMRAHAESAALAQAQQQVDRRRPAPLDLRRRREEGHDDSTGNVAVGMRGYRMQASVGRLGQGLLSPATSMNMGTNLIGDDDFHSSSAGGRNDVSRAVGSAAHARHNPHIHPAHVNARLSRDSPPSAPSALTSYPQMQRSPLPLSPALLSGPASNQESSPNLNQAISYQAAAHMRASTLPQHRGSSARDGQQIASARGHYQHNSMSMPAQNLRTPQHANVAAFGGSGGVEGNASTIYEDSSREEEQQHQQRPDAVAMKNEANVIGTNVQVNISQPANKLHYSPPGQSIFGDMESSSSTSSLISPTLTYGTQTPSTLSPATPFFGSFHNHIDGFEKGGHGPVTDGQQKKQVVSAVGH